MKKIGKMGKKNLTSKLRLELMEDRADVIKSMQILTTLLAHHPDEMYMYDTIKEFVQIKRRYDERIENL